MDAKTGDHLVVPWPHSCPAQPDRRGPEGTQSRWRPSLPGPLDRGPARRTLFPGSDALVEHLRKGSTKRQK